MPLLTHSKQPRKQRKTTYVAPLHVRRKNIACHFSDDLIKKYNKRSATVRRGDTVKVMRGPEGVADHTAKVIGIDTDTGRILVEGLTIPKADGKLKPRAVHASNCIITKVDTTDKLRVEKLSGGAEPKEERAGRKTGMQEPRVKKAIGSNSSQSESAKSKEPAKKTIEEKNKNDAPKKDKESTEESA